MTTRLLCALIPRMPRKDFGKTVGAIMFRLEQDARLLERLSAACDRAGESNVKDTTKRLLESALLREEIDAERTGAALNAAMRPVEGNLR